MPDAEPVSKGATMDDELTLTLVREMLQQGVSVAEAAKTLGLFGGTEPDASMLFDLWQKAEAKPLGIDSKAKGKPKAIPKDKEKGGVPNCD